MQPARIRSRSVRSAWRMRGSRAASFAVCCCGLSLFCSRAVAQEDSTPPEPTPLPGTQAVAPPATTTTAAAAQSSATLYVREYRVSGAKRLPRREVEDAVYPYLGPGRTPADVEQARCALEKAYKDHGYQTVTVQVPAQQARRGIVLLNVVEAPVGRLRVTGSRYFSPRQIKREAPSLQEGNVPEFSQVTRDIVALNQLPDRRVTPSLAPGVEPGTVDVTLDVKDTFPAHGSIELNNRYSPQTTALRLNGSISYSNLWQLGHSIGFSFQVAPERVDDALVFAGYYIARIPSVSWLSLMLQGTKQDSDISTLGGAGVTGRGNVIGTRAVVSLPQATDFYHSIVFGFDRKHFDQNLTVAGESLRTPITYYPFSAIYSATWAPKGATTVLNVGLNFHVRGLGSDEAEFDFNRFKSGGSFVYLRGDLSHTHDLPRGFQVYGKIQGQASDQPLLNTEEFSGGGLATARGYLESEVLGDDALLGTFEFRSPSLLAAGDAKNEWRVYGFIDGGVLSLIDPLPQQASVFRLASVGIGTRLQFRQHFNGSLDLGFPLIGQTFTDAGDPLLTFRVSADF